MSNTQKYIDRVCEYRGVPKIKKGTPCSVDGKKGVIWGGNGSANFNVKFEDGRIMNCHPYYKMKIFNTQARQSGSRVGMMSNKCDNCQNTGPPFIVLVLSWVLGSWISGALDVKTHGYNAGKWTRETLVKYGIVEPMGDVRNDQR